MVRDFEAKVSRLEEVTLVVRAPSNAMVEDYSYERKAASNASLTEWIEQRIKPCLGAYEFTILDGNHAVNPHGKTSLKTLRNGYSR